MIIKKMSPQRENLIEWLDLFSNMQYIQSVKIHDVNSCNIVYNGRLADMTYSDMLELEDYKFDGLIKTDAIAGLITIYCKELAREE